jgi:hypothetical protein
LIVFYCIQPINVVASFPTGYPEFIEPHHLNQDVLNSINNNTKLKKQTKYTQEDKEYYENLYHNSLHNMPTNLRFPDIQNEFDLHNIIDSDENQLDLNHLRDSQQPIIVNELQQMWLNQIPIPIQLDQLILWNKFKSEPQVAKILQIQNNCVIIKLYRKNSNNKYHERAQKTLWINRLQIVAAGDILTNNMTLRVSFQKIWSEYQQMCQRLQS